MAFLLLPANDCLSTYRAAVSGLPYSTNSGFSIRIGDRDLPGSSEQPGKGCRIVKRSRQKWLSFAAESGILML